MTAVKDGCVVAYADGMYKAFNPVVMVGEQAYPSIQAAIDAVPEGETATIKVAKNHEITTCTVLNWDDTYPMLVIVENKHITLDLNGNTVEVKKDFGMGISSVFYVCGDATFNFVDSSEEGTGAINAYAYSYSCFLNRMFWSGTGATMNFYSGTYTLQKNPNDSNARFGWMLYNNVGDTNIYGGTFIMANNGFDMLGTQGTGVRPKHKHVIYGGKFNRNVAKITDHVNIAEGSVQRQNAGGMYEVFEVVAKIGDAPYKTLAEAVEAAQAKDVVTLVKDVTGAGVVINKDVTINFNEKTYTFDGGVGSNGTETLGLQILKDNNVTLMNGTLTSTGDKVKMLIQNYANLTVENMNLVDATNAIQYVLSSNYGKTQILGNTNITTDAVAFDSYDYTKYYPAPAVVIVKTKGTIKGAIEKSEKATIEIYSGTYSFDVKDFCAPRHATVDNHDGTWTVEALDVDEMTIDFMEYYKRDAVFEVQNDKTIGKFTYTRDLSGIGELANAWVALYLPVEIPVAALGDNYEVAYLNNVYSYDKEGNDGIVDDMVMEYIIIKNGTLFANTPYMIRKTDDSDDSDVIEFTLNDVTLCKTVGEGAKLTVLNMSSAYVEFSVGGVYKSIFGNELLETVYSSRFNTVESPSIYVPYQNNWSNGDGNHASVFFSPFNVYLTLNMKEGAPFKFDAEKLSTIGSRVIGEENDGVTTIYDVPVDMNVEGLIFDLSGRRVNETEKGIYIKDGKKVLVK